MSRNIYQHLIRTSVVFAVQQLICHTGTDNFKKERIQIE